MDSLQNYTFFAPYNFNGYPASKGLVRLLSPLFNGAAEGTNIKHVVEFSHNLLGPKLPDILTKYVVSTQISLFGDYPVSSDLAPSILFTVLFGVAGLIHLLIFCINFSRGHYFWISFVWAFNCALKLIGFALRAVWSQDVTKVAVGLTSEVFLIIPSIIFVSFDLILAQRLFTWRHPVGGSRTLFWAIMISMYVVVCFLIAITVMASFIPYLHFLSEKAWQSWRKVNMATGVLIILYSLTSMSLIGLSYLFPPTAKDENLYTYQPWWIESFNTFYFVQPGAAKKAEETFMKRNHNHRHAIRVIAATRHHSNMVEGLSNQRGSLSHNYSMGLIIITTVLIFIESMGRCIVLFQNNIQRNTTGAGNRVFMYICWGAFELIINILYIVGRVDLRFYRPDRLPQKVRAIITAEQSFYPSENEEESSSGGSFTSASAKSYANAPESPPYPRDEFFSEKRDFFNDGHEKDDDNISDFHF
ncbi:hypothetical protein OXX80_002222 [Metschnikowia pulcherrima]